MPIRMRSQVESGENFSPEIVDEKNDLIRQRGILNTELIRMINQLEELSLSFNS